MDLKDKVIWITGASRGIGAELSEQLAQAGARVILAARDSAQLEQQASRLRSAGLTPYVVPLDVTSDASVQAAVSNVLGHFGAIDVLINNAGNGGQLACLLDHSPEHTRQMFEVHVFGAERMTRAVLPSMLERGQGRIVTVSSAVGYVPMPGAAAYSAAKAAIVALTDALRGELVGRGVELAVLSPPHTQTDAGRQWPLELPKRFTPAEAARGLLKALQNDEQEYLVGGNQSLLWLRRLAPRGAATIMRKIGLSALSRLQAGA
jgi:short-subunit dehydrogenase